MRDSTSLFKIEKRYIIGPRNHMHFDIDIIEVSIFCITKETDKCQVLFICSRQFMPLHRISSDRGKLEITDKGNVKIYSRTVYKTSTAIVLIFMYNNYLSHSSCACYILSVAKEIYRCGRTLAPCKKFFKTYG